MRSNIDDNMTIKQKRRQQLGTPANIAASAFNLPIMVILGVFVGDLISKNFEPPIREFVLILTIIEIYAVVQYQTRKEALLAAKKQRTLSDLILENEKE